MVSIIAPAAADSPVVDITRPEGNEIVAKDVFTISGVCVYDNTTIELEYLDRDTETFKPLYTTDKESSFKVGSNKLFAKDIVLKYKGENVIKITASTKIKDVKPQEKKYTITWTTEEKKKSNWFEAAINWLKDLDEKK